MTDATVETDLKPRSRCLICNAPMSPRWGKVVCSNRCRMEKHIREKQAKTEAIIHRGIISIFKELEDEGVLRDRKPINKSIKPGESNEQQ